MNIDELKNYWLSEQELAHVHGWDFSYIKGRFKEEQTLSWNYKQIILSYLQEEHSLLDIDTGGGEFLLSLNHPYENTSATEGYPPNVQLCHETLSPLGINFQEMSQYNNMPFDDNQFDIVINRHGDYDVSELYRILKPNGLFITQQVGCDNDRELVELLLPGTPKPFPNANLSFQSEQFLQQGFSIIQSNESFSPIRFFDTGALVWFARIIQWEFPEFSVEKCFDNLLKAETLLKKNGSIDGTTHRYLIVARK